MKRTVHHVLSLELAFVCLLFTVFGGSVATAITMFGQKVGAAGAAFGLVCLVAAITMIGSLDAEEKNVVNK